MRLRQSPVGIPQPISEQTASGDARPRADVPLHQNECPLLDQSGKGGFWREMVCPLMTQSGHGDAARVMPLNVRTVDPSDRVVLRATRHWGKIPGNVRWLFPLASSCSHCFLLPQVMHGDFSSRMTSGSISARTFGSTCSATNICFSRLASVCPLASWWNSLGSLQSLSPYASRRPAHTHY